MSTHLETFRKQTIEKSLQLASQRLATQRRFFSSTATPSTSVEDASSASGENNQKNTNRPVSFTATQQKLTQDHLRSIATDELQNFGTIAVVAPPFRGIRVTCSAAASSNSENNNDNNNGVVFMGYNDGSISLWSVPDGRWIARGKSGESDDYKFESYSTGGVAISSSTGIFASAHRNGVLALWKLGDKSNDQQQELSPVAVIENAHNQSNSSSKSVSLRQCEFSPIDSSVLATTGDDGTVKIWSLVQNNHHNNNTSLLPLLSLENGPSRQFSSQSGATSSSVFSGIGLNNNNTSSITSTAITNNNNNNTTATPGTRCLAFHPDGALLAVGDSSGSFSLWDLRDASRLHNSSTLKPLHSGRVNAIRMNSNGYNFCTGGDDGLVYSFDLRKLSSSSSSAATPYVWRQAAHGDAVTTLSYGKSHSLLKHQNSNNNNNNNNHLRGIDDSSVLFSGGLDGIVAAWDSWTGEQLWRSESSEVKNYVTWPKIVQGIPRKPAVRSICYVSKSGSGHDKQQLEEDSSKNCETTKQNNVSDFLVVMKREAQWTIYSAESGSYAGNRNVSYYSPAFDNDDVATMNTENAHQDDAGSNLHQLKKDAAGDESDDSDDDDILGALMKKK